MENQIEKMAIELGINSCKKTPCKNCAVDYCCIWRNQAARLYNAGYRKASEVAEEIFAEIEQHLETGITLYGETVHFVRIGTLAELKKKYTEGGE